MSHTRIVAFLGVPKNYHSTTYAFLPQLGSAAITTSTPSPFHHEVWLGLAGVRGSDSGSAATASVIIVGTEKTWCGLGGALKAIQDAIRDILGSRWDERVALSFALYDEPEIADAAEPAPFWKLFALLQELLGGSAFEAPSHRSDVCPTAAGTYRISDPRGMAGREADKIVVDITHGFRSVPFVAGSVLTFVQSSQRRKRARNAAREIPAYRIIYGAYDADRVEKTPAPIWDLTPVALATDLSSGLDAFVRYGRADTLADVFDGSESTAGKAVASAMRDFAGDLALLRVPRLLDHSIHTLASALRSNRAVLERSFGPAAGELSEFQSVCEEIAGASVRPVSKEGVLASARLVQQLLEVNNFTGAWGLIRESLVNVWTTAKHSTPKQPSETGFDIQRIGDGGKTEKNPAEKRMKERAKELVASSSPAANSALPDDRPDPADAAAELAYYVGNLRNDVHHCGHREGHLDAEALRKPLTDLLARLKAIAARLPVR